MSIETEYFKRRRPNFPKLEPYGFRHEGDVYSYAELLPGEQFRAEIEITEAGAITGRVIDLDTGEEYLPIRLINQVGEFVGTVREKYLAFLMKIDAACFTPVHFMSDQAAGSEAWMIPSNPALYDVDAGFRNGGGEIEWHQHNHVKAGDAVFIYSSAPYSALMYRCEVVAADLPYQGMFRDSRGYTKAMRIRLIEKYPPDLFPLSFIKAHGGSVVRSARSMPSELYQAIREKRQKDYLY